MRRLVECVPNFSEGRDARKVDALVEAMCAVPGVVLLDREMDADHNRCVLTLAGAPEAVAEAALRGVGKAVELIDLTQHTGAHPRIGAADVVPFVPIEGLTLDDCVVLARRVGREIWERYRVPVYFYEAAATRPERVPLENIRRGQFEGLREEVERNPERAPDIGEARLHPTAGAVAVGARKFLIAYNINLATPEVEIARKIARTIRFSSGGLRYVKAMGVELHARGLAQVSINLTDFESTPLHVVFEMVKREAARYGVNVVGSEIVGLVPRRAIEMTADYYLQLENFSPAQVLENRLAMALAGLPGPTPGRLAAMAAPLLEAVAAPTATPGGGSVAALAGALSAALGQMVAGLSRKRKSQAQHVEPLSEALDRLRRHGEALAAAMDRDAEAFQAVLAAFQMPKETPEQNQQREQAIQQATRHAAEVPLATAEQAAAIFEQLGQLEPLIAPSMLSDLRVGRLLAAAAVEAALANVEINLKSLADREMVTAMREQIEAIRKRIAPAEPVVQA
jgi:glutamate formiminotransferase/formiminotetrahydrofolate cyclodeaminase